MQPISADPEQKTLTVRVLTAFLQIILILGFSRDADKIAVFWGITRRRVVITVVTITTRRPVIPQNIADFFKLYYFDVFSPIYTFMFRVLTAHISQQNNAC